jgi:predicted ribosome quality control (RQC) complex YloA/Tae2 family protein
MSSQPPKDFLALSHGHEWVDFYESFDKLVQDHLSRSSELLRKAMSLPEVADREVAQVRDDLESRLTAERAQNQATLSTLKQEITSSHQQAASLAQLVGSLMAQLDRLNGNVESALAKIAENEAIAPSGAAQIESGAPVHVEAPVASAPESASTEWSAEAAEEQSEPVAESNEDWSQLTDEAKDESADEIDLSALAAMEEATNEAEDSDEAEAEVVAANNGSERTRPHWLSMARSGQ